MASPPQDPDQFLERMAFLKVTREAMSELYEKAARIDDLGDIMRQEQWKMPDDCGGNLVMVNESLKQLERSVEHYEGIADEEQAKFIKMIEESVPALLKEAKIVKGMLDHMMIADANADMARVLNHLNEQT